jgi:hypothetical protein
LTATLVGFANPVAAMIALYMGHAWSAMIFFAGSVAFVCFMALGFYLAGNCMQLFGAPSPGSCEPLGIAALVALAAADCCLVAGLVAWRRERWA